MKVLILGSGGREHALCWAISASPLVDALYCAPGNGGISREAKCVSIAADDAQRLIEFCRSEAVDFVIVGPEGPLVSGIVDELESAGIKSFGPSAAAARLEASKGFTKELCEAYNIPTGSYGRFREAKAAKAFITNEGVPIVVKADGLASGKGVTVAQTVEEAEAAVDDLLGGRFGAAGEELIIEEYLTGEEASFFALVDGNNAIPLASAQDHKALGEGDIGPNTGGMGAYSPAPVLTEALQKEVMSRIISPTVRAMSDAGTPFKGVLYAGLMITEDGPKLLEYNVRFGDPECQVLMPRLKSDILPALIAARDGVLDKFDLRWKEEAALCVVIAARGYPGTYSLGTPIENLEAAQKATNAMIFHAGTKRHGDAIVSNGGRVLGVTALGNDIAAAQKLAYHTVDAIDWPNGFCRRDIGWRALKPSDVTGTKE